jgi:ParB family transcriptional regulator, chromosome partitioning protein
MSRKHHHLKTETEYFQAIERGEKRFELRKNDRDFKRLDILHLEETVNGVHTGRSMEFEVKYILFGGKYGLEEGYCILQF